MVQQQAGTRTWLWSTTTMRVIHWEGIGTMWSRTRARPSWQSAWAAMQSFSLAVMTHLRASPAHCMLSGSIGLSMPSCLILSIAHSRSA